jgi:hypothetical protein
MKRFYRFYLPLGWFFGCILVFAALSYLAR